MPKLSLSKLSMPKGLPFRRPGTPSAPDGSAVEGLAPAEAARRRRLLVAACGGAAAGIALLGYVLFGRSSATPEPASALSVPLATASQSPSVSPTASTAPSEAVNAAIARDPFQILYPSAGGGSSTGTDTGTGTGTDTGGYTGSGKGTLDSSSGTSGSGTSTTGSGTPSTSPPSTSLPTTSPPTTSPPTTSPPTSTPPVDPTKHTSIMLIASPTVSGSIYRATFMVDGNRTYSVNVGAAFAGSLKILSVHSDIDGLRYATVQYRTATPFDITAGQTVRLSG